MMASSPPKQRLPGTQKVSFQPKRVPCFCLIASQRIKGEEHVRKRAIKERRRIGRNAILMANLLLSPFPLTLPRQTPEAPWELCLKVGRTRSLSLLRLPGDVRAVVGCKRPGVVKKKEGRKKKHSLFYFGKKECLAEALALSCHYRGPRPSLSPATSEGRGPRSLPPLPRAEALTLYSHYRGPRPSLSPATTEGRGPRSLPPLPSTSWTSQKAERRRALDPAPRQPRGALPL